jgi:hypothetical protein
LWARRFQPPSWLGALSPELSDVSTPDSAPSTWASVSASAWSEAVDCETPDGEPAAAVDPPGDDAAVDADVPAAPCPLDPVWAAVEP